MRFILCFFLIMAASFLYGNELFPFKPGGYIVYGKVNVVPEAEEAKRGQVEILEGGFTRHIEWNENRGTWLEISLRFRNVANCSGKPGLEVTINDKNGFAGQVYGTLTAEEENLRCTVRIPVGADSGSIQLWCYGVKDTATGVDQYIIREIPVPEIRKIPQTPVIRAVRTESEPYTAELCFLNYLDNSLGAVVERSEDGGKFEAVGEIPTGFHSFSDRTVQSGRHYSYRVKNRSHGGESEWSAVFPAVIPLWKSSPGNKVYYADSVNGNDENDGMSPQTAWKSVKRINCTVFAPGDRIKLKRGSVWNEPVELRGSGTAGSPIRLSAYGEGPLPAIAVKDTFYAVHLKNQVHWDISELDLSNRQTVPDVQEVAIAYDRKVKRGSPFFPSYARRNREIAMFVELENYGVAEDVHIHDLNIHDVEGPQNCKESGGIVVQINGSRKPSRFHNLTIKNNRLTNVCRSGIVFVVWPHALRTHWFPSTDVVISGNRLQYIGGDGIVPWSCDGVKVTGNILLFGACTALDPNAGIWPWSCDNAVFSGNISGFTCKFQGNGDGQGYDVDTNNYNTTMENNLSFMNGGGFMLICGEADTLNSKVTVRNNVSVCDGMSIISLWNNLKDVDIHHNTFVTVDDCKAVFLLVNWGTGDTDPIQMERVQFHDNIVVADTPLTFRGMQKSWEIFNNVYSGTYAKGLVVYGRDNRISDPRFKGVIQEKGDIMAQLEKLLSDDKLNAGADVQKVLEILKENGCLPE